MSKEKVTDTGKDVNNTATVTSSMNVEGVIQVGFHMKEASGNHASAVWRMYCSPDNSAWYRTTQVTSAQVNGQNKAESFDVRGTQYIRFKVDTVSAAAGTEDTIIIS